MTDLSFTSKDLSSLTTDALVIGVVQTPSGPALSPSDALPEAVRTTIDLTLLGVSGALDTVTRIPGVGLSAKIIVLTGLGCVTMFSAALRPRRSPLWKLSIRFWSLV